MMDSSSKEYVEPVVADSYSNSEEQSRGQLGPKNNPCFACCGRFVWFFWGGMAVILLLVGSSGIGRRLSALTDDGIACRKLVGIHFTTIQHTTDFLGSLRLLIGNLCLWISSMGLLIGGGAVGAFGRGLSGRSRNLVPFVSTNSFGAQRIQTSYVSNTGADSFEPFKCLRGIPQSPIPI